MLPPVLQYLFAALFGLAIGSFLTVVIHRLPIMMERAWRTEIADEIGDTRAREGDRDATPRAVGATASSGPGAPDAAGALDAAAVMPPPLERYDLALPRSACPSCGHVLRPVENIPLVSYLLARGRCRACGHAIGILYPLVEVLTMAMALVVLRHFGAGWTGVAAFGLCASLIALAFIDARTHLLPDVLTLPLLWTGLLLNVGDLFVPLTDAVIGAAAGYLFLWLIYWGFRLLRGKEGMGYGDFKLLAALGAWLGWQALPQIVLLAALAGSLFGLAALFSGRRRADQPLPFGPYLAFAGGVALFFGDPLRHWIA
ncbi:A24 family peptidase [Robbsia sp. Bb-Pol-6]|uniref:Prepilin leader peptidase/N-methyltransferase n=2 Tax=Robbsia betulipollinis TaxID=2981849 RepID=A0ABT3ZQT8_9BURK|nr:A24 family peptidase [Robbsia betulipollinis]MCY0388924.1 A24 family peptidase [Robbsia betulipollinis]